MVRCYRQDVVRKVEANNVECFVCGEFGAIINFAVDKTEHCDTIMIEVAAATKDIAWTEMRDFVMAMESVLLNYPGLKSTKQNVFKRFVVDSTGHHEVSHLMNETQDQARLRSKMPWLPPDFGWFIQCAWTKPGKLDELRAQKITLQLPHRLDVLGKLVVSSEPRQFPALWTLSYSDEAPVIELRIHSDLSGVCYHVPLRITVSKDFVRQHAHIIQAGVSVLSVVSLLIPIDVAKTAVETALSASRTALDRAQAVNSILEKADLGQGGKMLSTEIDMPVQSRMVFLRELLKLHDPTFDDLKVGEVSNLCCAATGEGRYVWVHPRELDEMKDHLTPCHPPKPQMTPSAISTSISKSISICVTQLLWKGCVKGGKKIYCEWKVVHQSRQADTGKTDETIDLGADITWSSSPEELADVSSIIMLRECTVKTSVKLRHIIRRDEVIGCGEVHLKDHISLDCSNSSPVEIKIPLTGEKIPQSSTVICEFSIK